MKPLRKLLTVLLVIALAAALFWRTMRHFVPSGAKPTAFLLASTEPQISASPHGRKLYYRFNDAGAAHSGFHYTWCYVDHWLLGKRVILAGYSKPDVRTGEVALPVVWHEDGSEVSVQFAAGRHDPAILWSSSRLP